MRKDVLIGGIAAGVLATAATITGVILSKRKKNSYCCDCCSDYCCVEDSSVRFVNHCYCGNEHSNQKVKK